MMPWMMSQFVSDTWQATTSHLPIHVYILRRYRLHPFPPRATTSIYSCPLSDLDSLLHLLLYLSTTTSPSIPPVPGSQCLPKPLNPPANPSTNPSVNPPHPRPAPLIQTILSPESRRYVTRYQVSPVRRQLRSK